MIYDSVMLDQALIQEATFRLQKFSEDIKNDKAAGLSLSILNVYVY